MKHRLLTLVAVATVSAVSCGRRADVHWKDGNFQVYPTDLDFKATRLGYSHHPGTLRLVEAEVIAAGSTAQFVFVSEFPDSAIAATSLRMFDATESSSQSPRTA
jgi:hypothetical protein